MSDIHGCLEEFDELLKLVEFVPVRDQLIIGGDLVDRGPDSVGVVRRARELNARCVLGNHESKQIKYRHDMISTGLSRKRMSPQRLAVQASLTEPDWAFLEALPLFIRLSPTLVIVHAGLERGIPIERQSHDVLTMMRYAWRDTGEMVGMKPRGKDFIRPDTAAFWTELWDGAESVIYGHHPQRNGKVTIDINPNGICWGLDTGCAFGKALSALIFTDERFVTGPEIVAVPAKATYAKLFRDVVVPEDEFKKKSV